MFITKTKNYWSKRIKFILNRYTHSGKRIRFPLLLIFSLLWVLAFIISLYTYYHLTDDILNENIQEQFNEVYTFYNNDIKNQAKYQELILFDILNNKEVINNFNNKNISKLKAFIKPAYQQYNQQNKITHFYFIRADKTVLYRVHNDKRDDLINRLTLDEAAQTLKVTSGIELGAFGTLTLRSVAPVLNDNQLIGFIEVGMEIEHLMEQAEKQFNIHMFELLEKALIGQQAPLYFTDRKNSQEHLESYIINFDSNYQITPSTITRINKTLAYSKNNFLLIDGIASISKEIQDYASKQLGYIVTFIDVRELIAHQKSELNQLIYYYLLIYLLGFILFNSFLQFVEKIVREYVEEQQQQAQLIEENIKQLKLAQTQLLEKEKFAALGNMVAGVAHEINTPLGICVTSSSFLSEKVKVIKQQFSDQNIKKQEFENFLRQADESSKIIHTNLNRAAELVSSFKQVAVDQTNETSRQVNFLSLIEEVLFSLKPELKKAQHHLIINCSPDLDFYTIPGYWSQVLINLITNSLKHGFEDINDGTIEINALKSQQEFTLIYADNGRGIIDNESQKVFEPFYTTKRSDGGTGLGLHLTYNIITQAFGGTIKLASNGDGVQFTIKVPI